MQKKKAFYLGLWVFFFLSAICFRVPSAEAELQYGKTYDQSNYQEIEEFLAQGQRILVKNGDIIFHVKKLEYDIKREPAYLARSQENAGKFDVDPEGNLIHKGTGEPVIWFYGYPFPNIDPKDPKVCYHLMHNFESARGFDGKGPAMNKVDFVGDGGSEKQIYAYLDQIYYLNRESGQIPNPNGFVQQSMQVVHSPYDVRGVISMSWVYIDTRQDTAFSYLPMLRRVRRVSAASRSDPFFGGDSGTDDAYGYYGKIAAMEYKYLGERTIIVPWMTAKKNVMTRLPDGSVIRPYYGDKKLAYQVPGSQQAPFVWEGVIWTPIPVYLVEAHARDPYYNYGKQIFHISKDMYSIPYKDVYDKSGEYWKCNHIVDACWFTNDGRVVHNNSDISWMIDLRSRHSTPAINVDLKGFECRYFIPYDQMNENSFTTSEMIQRSK